MDTELNTPEQDSRFLSVPAAANAAATCAGFDGTNPDVIAGLVFALTDVLREAGYSYSSVAVLLHNVADRVASREWVH